MTLIKYMKCKNITLIRWVLPLMFLSYILGCRYHPAWAEAYARWVYPLVSTALSAFSSLFPFSLEEVLVVGIVVWMLLYPFWKRRKNCTWKSILMKYAEVLVWIYIWFYMAWGLNYFRHSIYTRLQITPAAYDESTFQSFLESYTDSLNAAYVSAGRMDEMELDREVKSFYRNLPTSNGLVVPKDYQTPKFFTFTSLYSKVGVLGSMGPFFAESQLNADLLPMQLPFTYAHEFSHLLGVSNEAEANYWAYRACIESSSSLMKYSGYMGLFPYVLVNANTLLEKEEFEEWLHTVRPEVIDEYNAKRVYWQERYSPFIGRIQDFVYNLFLKGNQIPSGKKNYAEVISILLSEQG